MKLIITSTGDMSVGIFPQQCEIDCPFEMDAGADVLDEFKAQQEAIYKEFFDDAVAKYDFEFMEDDVEIDEMRDSWKDYQRVQAERAHRDAWGTGE